MTTEENDTQTIARALLRRVLGNTDTLTLTDAEVGVVGIAWLRTAASRANWRVTSLDGGGLQLTRKETDK